MQKVIEETRAKLMSYTGATSDIPFSFTAPPEPHAGRFVRKIPKQNYEKLGKFLPISWL